MKELQIFFSNNINMQKLIVSGTSFQFLLLSKIYSGRRGAGQIVPLSFRTQTFSPTAVSNQLNKVMFNTHVLTTSTCSHMNTIKTAQYKVIIEIATSVCETLQTSCMQSTQIWQLNEPPVL